MRRVLALWSSCLLLFAGVVVAHGAEAASLAVLSREASRAPMSGRLVIGIDLPRLFASYGYDERVSPVPARRVDEPAMPISTGGPVESGVRRSDKSTSPRYDPSQLLRVSHNVGATNTPKGPATVTETEKFAPNPMKAADATGAWDDFLGPGEHTNINPRTGQADPNRIFSADGQRSIRMGPHEMNTSPTKFHYHQETWTYDPAANNWHVDNVVQRVPGKKP